MCFYPLLLESPLPLEKKQVLGSALVSEQRAEQIQLSAQTKIPCGHISVTWPEIDTLSSPFLKIFKSEFMIQDWIFWPIVNQNVISIYQNLSLGVENQK